jgi:predicted permease
MAGYTETTGPRFARELVDRVRTLPGVQAATLGGGQPMRPMLLGGVTVPGLRPPNGRPFFNATWSIVEPGYFETLQIPLVSGRDFDSNDGGGAPSVAIVDEATARRCWPGQDAIGQYLLWQPGRPTPASAVPNAVKRLTVIGVASGVKNASVGDEAPPLVIYVPLQQQYIPRLAILARTTHGQRIATELRGVVASMNPNLPILAASTLEDHAGPVQTQLRVAASVSGGVGLIGLLLASIGLYGVTAYTVARRAREIGIRLALGAHPADVVRMILWQGMSLVAAGALIGLSLAVGAGRLLTRLFPGLPTVDPVTLAGTAALFAAIGLAACYAPARRATRVDAMEALRYE